MIAEFATDDTSSPCTTRSIHCCAVFFSDTASGVYRLRVSRCQLIPHGGQESQRTRPKPPNTVALPPHLGQDCAASLIRSIGVLVSTSSPYYVGLGLGVAVSVGDGDGVHVTAILPQNPANVAVGVGDFVAVNVGVIVGVNVLVFFGVAVIVGPTAVAVGRAPVGVFVTVGAFV